MKIKFKKTKFMPVYTGVRGYFKDGDVQDIDNVVAKTLIEDYPENFSKVLIQPESEKKIVEISEDKMVKDLDEKVADRKPSLKTRKK